MDETKQRIKIAEVCGWTKVKPYLRDMEYGGIDICGLVPDAEMMDSQGADYKVFEVPNYLYSLDAMHEAEKILTISQSGRYHDTLHTICTRKPLHWRDTSLWHATAKQRAEAFLRTLNLWED